MEPFRRLVLVGALAAVLARPMCAQSKAPLPKRADLLGTWVLVEDTAAWSGDEKYRGHQLVDFLILTDSTWNTFREMDGERHPKIAPRLSYTIDLSGRQDGKGGWVGRTRTDEGWKGRWTLVGDTLQLPGGETVLVAVQGEHLFVDILGSGDFGDYCNVYTRYTPGTPLPAPAPGAILGAEGACTSYGKR